MSNQKRARQRPQPKSQLLKALANNGIGIPTPTTANPSSGKSRNVNVGDIVQFHSPIHHMTGTTGIVTAVVDDKRLVVRSFGHEDYDGSEWLVLRKKPKGTTPDGSLKEHYRFWFKKVLFAAPSAPPVPKSPKPPKVIAGTEALLAELASPDPVGASHVVIVPDSGEPA